MAYTLIRQVSKRLLVLVSLTSTATMAEQNQQQTAGVDEVIMQHVVVPPPSGPYASRLGMPGHARRAGHRMMGFFNQGMPASSGRPPAEAAPQEAIPATPVYPPQTGAGAPSRGSTNAGTYRPDEPGRTATPPVPGYGYPGRGYAPGYRQGPPRGYGYPPAPPPAYGYYPAPPGYATPWHAPQSQSGTSTPAPATGQAE